MQKTISCLIVEDDLLFVENFAEQISKLAFIKLVGHCKTYGETIIALQTQTIDLLFLDINLESSDGLNGFDLLKQVSNLPPTIIISNSPEYAVECYAIGKAKDFIVKPVDTKRLSLAITRALETDISTNPLVDKNSVYLKMGRKYQRFEINNIDYFEGYGIYSKVITNGSSYVTNESLTFLENLFGTKNFMRVHKSYIINLNKLTGFDSNKLFLKDIQIPIGTSYRSKLYSLLRLFNNEF